ncbi:fumarylacetoacetate hydrolase family protein [Pseudonocardia sp. GCM10023141]|uniref:fumarylacetoacetate hydrolase family protein n=1 Tax=Pseudonocardia sp. GCM10023141 TaxID=3252653 RepID=UPI0036163CA6
MRIANLAGRLVLVDATGTSAVDVATASTGRFDPHPQAAYARWDELAAFAATLDPAADGKPFAVADLAAPVPAPRQVFAIGLNYRDHAAESGFEPPAEPVVFTKFPSCITGPTGDVALPPGGHTDWEVELVAVIGRRAHHVPLEQGWSHVAGLTIGQDISERITQFNAHPPQFALGKSFPGFGPIGPWVVGVDEFADPDDIALECDVNGEQVQKGRTRDLVFTVPELIHRLSAILPLDPGDVIFTGTPAGVGMGRDPQRFLADGDELVTRIDGIGELRHRFVAG